MEVPELHRRASVWFAANGDSSQAIDHALAGGDTRRAADLMELAIPMMARERREAELARWVRAVPDEVVRNRPVLAVLFAGALTLVSDLDTVGERLSDVERSVRADDGTWPVQPPPDLIVVDEEGYRSLPARIAMYRAALALAACGPRRHRRVRAAGPVAGPAGRPPLPRFRRRAGRARVVDHG